MSLDRAADPESLDSEPGPESHDWERPSWLVSVHRSAGGDPVGAGLLVTPRHVLTCAHVVRPGRAQDVPRQPVFVRFQFASAHDPLPATVLPDGWMPATGEQTGDVAVLELGAPAPPEAMPAPLRTTDPGTWDHRFRAHGYPTGHQRGVPVRGEIIGHAGSEWLQVEASPHAGWGLEKGFSGSPVWDVNTRGVVGMLVARDTVAEVDRRTAYAIKVEALVRYWPELAPYVRDVTTSELRARLERLLWAPLTPAGEIPRVDQVDPHDIGVARAKYGAVPYDDVRGGGVRDGGVPYDDVPDGGVQGGGVPDGGVPDGGVAAADTHSEAAAPAEPTLGAAAPADPTPGAAAPADPTPGAAASANPTPGAAVGTTSKTAGPTAPHHTAPYVPRSPQDGQLGELLANQRFVLLAGRSKAGKSRTLYEALMRAIPGARLLVPRPGGPDLHILDDLSRLRLPTGSEPVVLWLDDLHRYLQPGGLDVQILDRLLRRQPAITIVATIQAKQRAALTGMENDVGRTARIVLSKATTVELPSLLGPHDVVVARELYPDEDFTTRGIGELMVAAPLLEQRFTDGMESCPTGWAVARAAADWLRMGLAEPLGEPGLRELSAAYLTAYHPQLDADDDAYRTGLAWAREPVAGAIALLHRAPSPAGASAYVSTPYIPEYLDTRDDDPSAAVPRFAWDHLADRRPAATLLPTAYTALVRGDSAVAEGMLRRIADGGDGGHDRDDRNDRDSAAWASLVLGEMYLYTGEFAAAVRQLERAAGSAVDSVAPPAQTVLAELLLLLGERTRPRELLERAVAARDPLLSQLAQVSLAALLSGEGENERAAQMLEVIVAAGDDEVAALAQAQWAKTLTNPEAEAAGTPAGGLLGAASRGKRTSRVGTGLTRARRAEPAEQPWTLSRALGESMAGQVTAVAQANLGGVLAGQGELDRAEELLRSVISGGQFYAVPLARTSLGQLLIARERYPEAERELRALIDYGQPLLTPFAKIMLAVALYQQDRVDQGMDLMREVADSGFPTHGARATVALGEWYAEQDDVATAEEWFGRGIAIGHPEWSQLARIELGLVLMTQSDDLERLTELLTAVIDDGHRHLAPLAGAVLGDVFARVGHTDDAERAYRTAIDTDHPNWSVVARVDLAALLAMQRGDMATAADLLTAVIDAEHPHQSPRAADLLGDLLAADGRLDEAERAYRTAIDTHHPQWSLVARMDLGVMLASADDFAAAESLLREVLGAGDAVAETWARAVLGLVLQATGRMSEGLAELRAAADADAGAASQFGRFHLAKRLMADGDEDAAEDLLRSVVEGEPSPVSEVARASLAVQLLHKDPDAAQDLLVAVEDSGDPEAITLGYLGAGDFLLDAGEIQMAGELLETALELADADTIPVVSALLGVVRRSADDLEGARELLTDGLAADDPDVVAMARRYLGSTQFKLGLLSEAEQTLLPLATSRARDVVHRPQALLLLGLVLATDNRPEEAYPWLEQAIESGDRDTASEAREVYADLLLSAGQQERARAVYAPLVTPPAAEGPHDGPPPAAEGAYEEAPRGEMAGDEVADGGTGGDEVADGEMAGGEAAGGDGPPGADPRGRDVSTGVSPAPAAEAPHPLPTTVLILLGDVAAAEGADEEAAFWYALARRA